jgi:phosphoglycerate dehydrogenase-like enzyme
MAAKKMDVKTINVIYSRPFKTYGPLDPQLAGLIASVSPRIRLWDVAELVHSENSGDDEHARAAREKLDGILAEAEVMFGFPLIFGLMRRAPKLKWVLDPLVGVEMFLTPEIVAAPLILTNARGIHDQVAELALLFALMLAKQSPACLSLQQEKKWQKFTPGLLSGKTLGILGLGHIGLKIARLAKAFHMKVIATEIKQMKKPGFVDVLLPAPKLGELLRVSDFVVIAIPLTRETAGLIGEKELRLLKASACLINIARGRIVNEEALIRVLREKRIAGAGLDVFAVEPLPADSPLWDLPNVVLTPHVAGLREDYDLLATRLFCKNLKRYLSGKPLLNVVDKVKGY